MNLSESLDIKAKYHYIVKTQLIVVLILIATFYHIYQNQRVQISSLNTRLANGDILLLRCDSNAKYGKLNSVSNADVEDEAISLVSLLVNLAPKTAEANYLQVSNKMSEQIRETFLKDSRAKIEYIKGNNLNESLANYRLELIQTAPFKYRTTVFTTANISVNGVTTGTRSEVIEIDFAVIRPTAQKSWALEISSFKRIDRRTYDSIKGARI